ncbi:MAG: EAL domain-containing protein [Rhodospirillales bacterium]
MQKIVDWPMNFLEAPSLDRATLDALTAHSPLFIIVLGTDGKVARVSDHLLHRLNRREEDVLGHAGADLIFGPSDQLDQRSRLQTLVTAPQIDSFESHPLEKVTEKGCREHQFRWDARPVDGETGPCLLLIGQEKSAQVRIERQRREAESRLDALIAEQEDAVVMVDRNSLVSSMNSCAAALLGLTEASAAGRPFAALGQGEGPLILGEAIGRLDPTNTRVEVEALSGAKGAEKTLNWRIRAIFDARGRVNGFQAIGRDVSQLRNAEREIAGLRAEVERLREGYVPDLPNSSETQDSARKLASRHQLLDHAEALAHFGHWHWEVEPDLLYWSDEIFRIRGLAPDKTPRKIENAVASYHPQDRARVRRILQESAQKGTPFHFEGRIVRPDGSLRHLACEGQSEVVNGKTKSLFGVLHDITETRETERQLRLAKDEAERANEAKTEFMGRLSHEFRTPLNNIIGFSETIVLEILGRIEPPSYRDYVQNILDSGKELLSAIDQMTDVKMLEDVLRRNEESYRSLVELSPDLICICTGDRIKLINSAGAGMLRAWSSDDLKDRRLSDFVHADSREGMKIVLRSSGSQHRRLPMTFVTMTGQPVALEVSAVALHTEELEGVMIVGRDVTERNSALEVAIAREKRLQAVMDTVMDAIITMDEKGIIQDCNTAVERIFGYRPEQVIGQDISILMPPQHAHRHRDHVGRYMASGESQIMGKGRELSALHKDGTEFPVMITVSEIFDDSRRLFTGIIRNLSENKQLSEKVTYLANYDSVTDLPNRTLVEDRVSQAIAFANRAGRGVGVLAFQINEFSMVTGTLGHGGGDELLRQVSARLMTCIRPADTLGRTGTNEFMIVAANLAETVDVNYIVERVNQVMENPFLVMDEEIRVTCASGASIYPKDGERPEELLRNATTALNVARKMGAGAFGFFDSAMTAEVAERLTLERDLKHAIERKEFQVFYQPQMDLKSGRVIGVEALVRWQHPRLGFVMPTRFIPVAEQTGLILDIGRWVMEEAGRQLVTWRDRGLGTLRVGINLSARQFRDKNLIPSIEALIEASGVDPQMFDFELTESLLMSDSDGAVETVRAIKNLGVRVSVDDFGTGYSSLAYLKRFAVDTLKIDQAFVREIDTNGDDEAIATAVISLGHSLNLRVIAEGVEHMGQVEALRAHDCDEIQGYILSRPVSADDLEVLLPKIVLPNLE